MQDSEDFKKIKREHDKQVKIKKDNKSFEDKMFRLILVGLFVMICIVCFILLTFSIFCFKDLFITGFIK